MKSIYIFVTILFLILPHYIYAQDAQDTIVTNKFSERIPVDLEIEVKVSPSVPIGYAYCFKGRVLNVVRGVLPDDVILITVLAGDTANYNMLNNSDENTTFKLFLMHYSSNEVYHTAYITGFVDSEKNSWRIVAIHKL